MTLAGLPNADPTMLPDSLEWYILAQLEGLVVVFPSILVSDTFQIERSQILVLPFYDPAILGCVHHAGAVVPLVAINRFFSTPSNLTREHLTVIRLSNMANNTTGIGLVANQVLGRQTREQLPPTLFDSTQESELGMKLFQPETLNISIWQPQRWQPAVSQAVEK